MYTRITSYNFSLQTFNDLVTMIDCVEKRAEETCSRRKSLDISKLNDCFNVIIAMKIITLRNYNLVRAVSCETVRLIACIKTTATDIILQHAPNDSHCSNIALLGRRRR